MPFTNSLALDCYVCGKNLHSTCACTVADYDAADEARFGDNCAICGKSSCDCFPDCGICGAENSNCECGSSDDWEDGLSAHGYAPFWLNVQF